MAQGCIASKACLEVSFKNQGLKGDVGEDLVVIGLFPRDPRRICTAIPDGYRLSGKPVNLSSLTVDGCARRRSHCHGNSPGISLHWSL